MAYVKQAGHPWHFQVGSTFKTLCGQSTLAWRRTAIHSKTILPGDLFCKNCKLLKEVPVLSSLHKEEWYSKAHTPSGAGLKHKRQTVTDTSIRDFLRKIK